MGWKKLDSTVALNAETTMSERKVVKSKTQNDVETVMTTSVVTLRCREKAMCVSAAGVYVRIEGQGIDVREGEIIVVSATMVLYERSVRTPLHKACGYEPICAGEREA